MKNRLKAMTITELAIVIMIMVIIYSVVLPSWLQVFTRRVEGEARTIIADLSLVRQMALTYHRDYCVNFNDTIYTIYNDTGCGNATRQIKKVALTSYIVNPATPFNLTFYGYFNNSYVILSDGNSTTDQINITLQHVNRTKSFSIYEATGYAKLL